LPWAWVAIAAHAAAQARWDDCLAAARKAKALHFNDAEDYLFLARLAKGEAAALVAEYGPRLSASNPPPRTLLHLTDALAAAGKNAEIDGAVSEFVNRLPVEVRGQASAFFRAEALYQQGKLKECADLCVKNPVLKHSPIHAAARLAMGDAKAAAGDPALAKVWQDPWHALALSVSFAVDGQAAEAAKWRSKAVDILQAREAGLKRAGKLLGAEASPASDDIARLFLAPNEKALFLVAMAGRFPERQAEYRALATRLNIEREPPYQLVRRALEHPVASKR
jgi:hypothetical protein